MMLQTQLYDIQSSLASHVDKVCALEALSPSTVLSSERFAYPGAIEKTTTAMSSGDGEN